MNTTAAVLIILLSCFTGWAITWIAIKIPFYPKNAIRIFGLTFHGVLPKNKALIAEKLGQLASSEALSFKVIAEKVINPDNLEKLKPEIDNHIDHFLRTKLKDSFPMASMLGEKTILQLKQAFLLELESLFPMLMKSYMDKLEKDVDIEKIITEKIGGFPIEKLETILSATARKDLINFQLMGAGVGLLIGIVQVILGILVI